MAQLHEVGDNESELDEHRAKDDDDKLRARQRIFSEVVSERRQSEQHKPRTREHCGATALLRHQG